MTAKEKEIKIEERKLMARIIRNKLRISKKIASMTTEEYVKYYNKKAEESKTLGLNVVNSLK